jgi:hypothetical protein
MVWDRGYWDCDDPERAYEKGKLDFTLEGEKLHGGWILTRMRKREGEKRTNWLLIKHRDEFAREGFWKRMHRWPQADQWTRSRRVKVGVRSLSSLRRGLERPQKRNGNRIALPRERHRQKSGPFP